MGRRGDRQDDAAVGGIGFQDLQIYRVRGLIVHLQLIRVLDAGVGAGNESLDLVTEIHHDTLFLHPADCSLRLYPRSEALRDGRPRVVMQLLQPQGDPLVLRVHVQDQHLDFLTLLQDLGRMLHPACPAHVGDVDQTVDSGLDLHKGPEGGEVPNGAVQLGSRGILHGEGKPGILLDLLHSQGDLLVLGIHLQDHRLDFVSDGYKL